MVKAIIDIKQETNRILNIIKAKYGLKDKSSAIDKICEEYSEEILEESMQPKGKKDKGLNNKNNKDDNDNNNFKDEFENKIIEDDRIKIVEDISKYNLDKYSPIDGKALKQCDKLSAFIEASLSISHGIKSKELLSGKKQIMGSLQEVQGVDFHAIAVCIDEEFCTTGKTQTTIEL